MYSKKFFIDFPSVLLICLPLLLITGPLLSDLAISLISLIYIFHIIIKKDYVEYAVKKVLNLLQMAV